MLVGAGAWAQETSPVERGKKALQSRAFVLATWSPSAYAQLWKQWQPTLKAPPGDYDQAVRDHYGLHTAPFDNDGLPMGLRAGKTILGVKGVTVDCMLCHGGSIMGKSYVGLGNSALDIQSVYEDLGKASGGSGKLPFTFGNVRGTSEAGNFAVFLLSFRHPDLKLRIPPLDLPRVDALCEDVPAWWHLKKKKTMYHTGTAHARSVRSIMQFMLTPDNGLSAFEREEPTFRDIQAYILSLEAPKYPFAIDHNLANQGGKLFAKNCASCHGTYGAKPIYPNKVVPLDVVGTDPRRLNGFDRGVGELYNQSWFAKGDKEGYPATEPKGYQAPPLDGVWATAPYFHNGSVPTLYNVLNSKSRPALFTRSFKTSETDYDKVRVGWKVDIVKKIPMEITRHEQRKYYDTTQIGRGNGGHTFGDDLTEDERRAVVEFLKTL